MPKDEPTNCPNMDTNDTLVMFRAQVNQRTDNGFYESPVDHFQAGIFQTFQLARLFNQGNIVFFEGIGTNTPGAKALEQLVDAGLVNKKKGARSSQEPDRERFVYKLSKEGKAICRWMLEGKC